MKEKGKDNSSETIYVHHIGIATDVLGPGKRLVLWLSGCPMNCPGCIEPELHNIEAGSPWNVKDLVLEIQPLLCGLNGITLSGGEPFFQANALHRFLQLLDGRHDVLVYSGYTSEYLKEHYSHIFPYIDIIISGAYEQDKEGSYLWRGSENQEILSPSGKYDQAKLSTWMNSLTAGIEVFFEDERMYVYGVPAKGVLKKLHDEMGAGGVDVCLQ